MGYPTCKLKPAGVMLMIWLDASTAVAVMDIFEYTVMVVDPDAVVGVVIAVTPVYVEVSMIVVESTIVKTKYVVPLAKGPHVASKTTGMFWAMPADDVNVS